MSLQDEMLEWFSRENSTATGGSMGTGWALYRDASGTPVTVTEGNEVLLSNNAGDNIESSLPEGITSLYDGSRITPGASGDFYIVRVSFDGYSSNNNGAFSVSMDISAAGDGSIEISRIPVRMLRGAGSMNEKFYTVTFPVYALDTFKTNGASVRIEAVDGDLTFSNAQFLIARVHTG